MREKMCAADSQMPWTYCSTCEPALSQEWHAAGTPRPG
jgi:hypothetical protein